MHGATLKIVIVLCYHKPYIATNIIDSVLREDNKVDKSIILKRAFKNIIRAWTGFQYWT
jgi:hypothetical protein